MLKVLIIDDEEPIREAIKILGLWEKLNIDIVLEANEGQSALKVLREQRPDIVLVDMKMPFMDGIEFLRIAREEAPRVKYIVISGYDDFEYTRTAIHSQVLDYLLKPINRIQLNEALEKAVKSILAEKLESQKDMRKGIRDNISRPMLKERILSWIIWGGQQFSILDEHMEMLEFNARNQIYGVVLTRVINFEQVCQEKFLGDAHSLYFSITNALDELFGSFSNCFSFRNDRKQFEIISAVAIDQSVNTPGENFAVKLQNALNQLREHLDIDTIICVGAFCDEVKNLSQSYSSAEAILNAVNLLSGVNKVYSGKDLIEKRSTPSIGQIKDVLIHAFEIGNKQYSKGVIENYFQEILSKGYYSIEVANRVITDFVILLEDLAYSKKMNVDEIMSKYAEVYTLDSYLTDVNLLEKALITCFENVFEKIYEGTAKSEINYVTEIKEYIDKKYFTDIRLKDFAEKYYISKEYLSKAFKEEFGYGIYEYALKVRMEHAIAMLDDDSNKIKDISIMLGYKDNNYFSKAFKSYYGISPSGYRDSENRSLLT
jgi:two-component system response regulator YesN